MRYLVLFFLGVQFLFSQISVKSFRELTMDTDARFNQKEDGNDEKCALIKIVTPYKEFDFDVGHAWVCGKDETQKGEIWLWVNEDSKYLTIRHKSLGILRRWRIPKKIEPLVTYELVLQTAKITQIVEESITTNFVTFDSQPSGAKIFIDGMDTSKITPFSTELMLGKHFYKLEKEGYANASGTFLLTRKETKRISEKLKNLSAKITFEIKPENATLKINGILKQEKIQKLPQGKYLIEITHPQYYKIKKALVVKANENETKKYTLHPKFGNLKLNSIPYGAKIYIDGKYYGKTPKIITKLLVGERKIKLTKSGYDDLEKNINIIESKNTKQTFTLNKKTRRI